MTIEAGTTVPAIKIRRIVKLAHEAHEITDQQARLTHALTGICALTGADVGAIFVFASPLAPAPHSGLIHGYSPSQTQAVLKEYATQDVGFDLMAERLRTAFNTCGQILARLRRELLDDRAWYNSPFVNDIRRRWGVDDCIYSLQGVGPACLGLGINRSFGATPFSAKDRALVEIFNAAISQMAAECVLGRTPTANDLCRASLPPRARQILDCLLRGDSNKDIAEQLQISPNTVHHYCKMVLRAFGVRSRNRLVAMWADPRMQPGGH